MRYRNVVSEAQHFNGLFVGALLTEESTHGLNQFVRSLGFPNVVEPDLMHITIIGTKGRMQWQPATYIAEAVTPLRWEVWTPASGRCLVLALDSLFLRKRYDLAIWQGARPKHKTFKPHLTVSYKLGAYQVPTDLPLPEMPLMLDYEYAKKFDVSTAIR